MSWVDACVGFSSRKTQMPRLYPGEHLTRTELQAKQQVGQGFDTNQTFLSVSICTAKGQACLVHITYVFVYYLIPAYF